MTDTPEGKQGGQCAMVVCVGRLGSKWLGDKLRGTRNLLQAIESVSDFTQL